MDSISRDISGWVPWKLYYSGVCLDARFYTHPNYGNQGLSYVKVIAGMYAFIMFQYPTRTPAFREIFIEFGRQSDMVESSPIPGPDSFVLCFNLNVIVV